MTKIHKQLIQKKLKTKMLLQVHDELVFDLHNSEEKIVKNIVQEGMTNVIKMQVPVEIEMGIGKNWLDAH